MVLVPALLGLKGNLEMTLASRFSTQVWNSIWSSSCHESVYLHSSTNNALSNCFLVFKG